MWLEQRHVENSYRSALIHKRFLFEQINPSL
jgi:hypothetical protein